MTPELRAQARVTMRAAGIRSYQVAEAAGITPKHMSQLMTGRVPGSLEIWQRIGAALGYRVAVSWVPMGGGWHE